MLPCRWLFMLVVVVASIGSGCASPGEPTPRRPITPQTVRDLQAWQQGDDVVLTFTLPDRSTRDEPLAMPPAIEIYRGEMTAGRTAAKASTKLVYTIPGEMSGSYVADGRILYREAIEPGAAGTERVYLVKTRATRNRASAESNRVAVRLHPAPAAVGNVAARVAGQSVALTWPRAESASYRVYRAEIAPESVAAASTNAANAVLRMPLVQVAQMGALIDGGSESLQYRDENVELGHAYLYIVRAVSQFGADTVESADSAPAAITVTEPVPPASPQDLEVVVVPAAGTAPAYVSLSWAISPEASAAGYVVYRSEQEGARGIRLNQEPLSSPTYRDTSVAAGRGYFYAVTTVDAAGQESSPNTAVEVQIPGP